MSLCTNLTVILSKIDSVLSRGSFILVRSSKFLIVLCLLCPCREREEEDRQVEAALRASITMGRQAERSTPKHCREERTERTEPDEPRHQTGPAKPVKPVKTINKPPGKIRKVVRC